MSGITRRRFTSLLVAGATTALSPWPGLALAAPKVVIVGGGFGGATAAKYLRRFDAGIEVTLVAPKPNFVTCPFSNTVIAGMNGIEKITHDYAGLRRAGVEVVHDEAVMVDGPARIVRLKGGAMLAFDRAIVAPGIGFRWDAVEGYDETVA